MAWDRETSDKAVELYLSGLTYSEVFERIGSTGPLKKLLLEAGTKPRRRTTREWPEEKMKQCVQIYAKHHSLLRVAEVLGCSTTKAAVVLKLMGVQQAYHWSPEDVDRLVAFYGGGATVADCCREFHTSKKTVKYHLRKRGIVLRAFVPFAGDRHYLWKGGRTFDKHGYILVKAPPNHPHKNNNGYIREHRLVMEKHLGRYLEPEEVVHHKDKNKANNVIENLELFSSNAEHLRDELTGQCPKWTEDGKRRISEGVRRARRNQSRSKNGAQQ